MLVTHKIELVTPNVKMEHRITGNSLAKQMMTYRTIRI
ncbi:MAG: hypothetical protein ACJASQ_003179 [Crocinitomicaceae bacterium]|jgi:hypothetical protein